MSSSKPPLSIDEPVLDEGATLSPDGRPHGSTISSAGTDEAPAGSSRSRLASWAHASLIGLFALASLAMLYLARDFLIPITAAFFLKLVLTPLVRRLRKWGVPEAVGGALVVLLVLLFLGTAIYLLAAPANDWVARAPGILRESEVRLRNLKESIANVSLAAEQVEQLTDVDGDSSPQSVVTGPTLRSLLFERARYLATTAAATIVLIYLLLASGDLFLRKMITVLPRLEDKVRAVDLSREIERNVARYLHTIVCINLSLGIVVGLVLHWVGMPNAMLWGMMVAIFNFVPYLGPFASLIVLTLAAFVTFDDASRALIVGGVYFAINAVEAYVITPAVVGKRMHMNPVAIFVSVIFLGWIWGVSGMLFAVPIIATIRLCCEHVPDLAPLGEFLRG